LDTEKLGKPPLKLPKGVRWVPHDHKLRDKYYEGIAFWYETTGDKDFNVTWKAGFRDKHVLAEWEDSLDQDTDENHVFSVANVHDSSCPICYADDPVSDAESAETPV
jgi:hypothetical protein